MKIKGIEYGKILGASGVQGFFGEGYNIHHLMGPFGPNFDGITFVSKTATLLPRDGNMELRPDFTPRRILPDCIKAKPFRGSMFNSVGLSNPGLQALLDTHEWQKRTEPFWISVMSVAETKEDRLDELKVMFEMLSSHRTEFSAPFGIQVNQSCPNTDEDPSVLIGESTDVLDLPCDSEIPRMPKYSIASAPIEAVARLNDHPNCAGICVSNTIPTTWDGIDWEKAWGKNKPSFSKYKGGGLSGKFLRPLVCDYIRNLRNAGFTKQINGGGGILCTDDVDMYLAAGASSCFIGTVATARPWRVQNIINRANALNW